MCLLTFIASFRCQRINTLALSVLLTASLILLVLIRLKWQSYASTLNPMLTCIRNFHQNLLNPLRPSDSKQADAWGDRRFPKSSGPILHETVSRRNSDSTAKSSNVRN